jgi:hypothetical protein
MVEEVKKDGISYKSPDNGNTNELRTNLGIRKSLSEKNSPSPWTKQEVLSYPN